MPIVLRVGDGHKRPAIGNLKCRR